MKTINLTQGKIAIVDDSDFDSLSKIKWHAVKRPGVFYAGGRIGGKYVLMHNYLIGSIGIDHVDCNGLNNKRSNLRLAGQSNNMMNKRKRQGVYSSDYKGVYFYKPSQRWRAQIKINGSMKCIGYFICEHDAALAYNKSAEKLFGDFARLNKIRTSEESVAA